MKKYMAKKLFSALLFLSVAGFTGAIKASENVVLEKRIEDPILISQYLAKALDLKDKGSLKTSKSLNVNGLIAMALSGLKVSFVTVTHNKFGDCQVVFNTEGVAIPFYFSKKGSNCLSIFDEAK